MIAVRATMSTGPGTGAASTGWRRRRAANAPHPRTTRTMSTGVIRCGIRMRDIAGLLRGVVPGRVIPPEVVLRRRCCSESSNSPCAPAGRSVRGPVPARGPRTGTALAQAAGFSRSEGSLTSWRSGLWSEVTPATEGEASNHVRKVHPGSRHQEGTAALTQGEARREAREERTHRVPQAAQGREGLVRAALLGRRRGPRTAPLRQRNTRVTPLSICASWMKITNRSTGPSRARATRRP